MFSFKMNARFLIICCILIVFVHTSSANFSSVSKVDNVYIVSLSGSHFDMGVQYGSLLQQELHDVLDILLKYFVGIYSVDYSDLVEQANLFYHRYSFSYQQFLEGMSQGSGLSLDDCKIINGMETLDTNFGNNSLFYSGLGACAFLNLPPNKTRSNNNLIGRNYDYSQIYGEIAKDYLNVIQLNEQNSVTTYIIGMIGQIYCPSCINENGIFMELNNGMPSGGSYVEEERQSLLINMLQIAQNSGNFDQADKQLMASQSDFSLIVNVADQKFVKSYEFSSTLGMKPYNPTPSQPFASTNYYQNATWVGVPPPTDATTWVGITRLQNLLNLSNSQEIFGIPEFQELMDTRLENGGAKWTLTIYQIIFDPTPDNMNVYLKPSAPEDAGWTKIPLGSKFQELFESSKNCQSFCSFSCKSSTDF